jgi:hypothetical protein
MEILRLTLRLAFISDKYDESAGGIEVKRDCPAGDNE